MLGAKNREIRQMNFSINFFGQKFRASIKTKIAKILILKAQKIWPKMPKKNRETKNVKIKKINK